MRAMIVIIIILIHKDERTCVKYVPRVYEQTLLSAVTGIIIPMRWNVFVSFLNLFPFREQDACWHNRGRTRWILITHTFDVPKDFWGTQFCWFFAERCQKSLRVPITVMLRILLDDTNPVDILLWNGCWLRSEIFP